MVRIANSEVDRKYGYIKLMDFKDDVEREIWLKKVQEMIDNWKSRTTVF